MHSKVDSMQKKFDTLVDQVKLDYNSLEVKISSILRSHSKKSVDVTHNEIRNEVQVKINYGNRFSTKNVYSFLSFLRISDTQVFAKRF